MAPLAAAVVVAVEELLLRWALQVQAVLVGGKLVPVLPQTAVVQRQTVAVGVGHELKQRTGVS